MARETKIEVLERDGNGPTEVKVAWRGGAGGHRARELVLRVGDKRRKQSGGVWMVVTIRSFYEDGSKAFVDRSTSRRKQPIKSETLARTFEEMRLPR